MTESRPNVRCPNCASSDVICYRDEGYLCRGCDLQEHYNGTWRGDGDYDALRLRWSDPQPIVSQEEMRREFEELQRSYAESDREWFWPVERFNSTREDRVRRRAEAANRTHIKLLYENNKNVGALEMKDLPTNDEIYARILANPDADEPRYAYARWVRTLDHALAIEIAEFIEGQLWIAEQLQRDPRQNIASFASGLPERAFNYRHPENPDDEWWGSPAYTNHEVYSAPTQWLASAGLINHDYYYRGFIENVAIRAVRFVELADELFGLAPIRHLTLTYCKGHEHDDRELWKAVLASPYFRQIRSLRIWEHEKGFPEPTVMNKLDDLDLELLAASPNAQGLVYLEMRNQTKITRRGLDALATSPNLRGLSFVGHDYFSRSYPVTTAEWGGLGRLQSHLSARVLHAYKVELESAHGYIPWLHPIENYGSESPFLEAVVAHPVALIGR